MQVYSTFKMIINTKYTNNNNITILIIIFVGIIIIITCIFVELEFSFNLIVSDYLTCVLCV